MPILINIETVERSFGTEILKGHIGDISRAARIRLNESDIISPDNADVSGMLDPFVTHCVIDDLPGVINVQYLRLTPRH